MNNNNLIILALWALGIPCIFAVQKERRKLDSGIQPQHFRWWFRFWWEKQLSFDEVLKLINATLDTFGNIQLTYNQKVTAVKDIEKLINAGKSQQEIEIEMGNKYKLTPTQVRSIINKLYA
jgi:hypothetical protein